MSANQWMNASDLSPASWKARRWLRCAVSLAFPGSPATRSSIATKECGLDGLYDRSRAPYRQANKLPFQVERTILGIKKAYPSWGAPKIRDKLVRQYPMIPIPAVSTVHAALDRNGLVKRRKRKRHKARGTALMGADTPNGLWCADYKGEFMLGNKRYCYPLTVTDYRSRYLLTCEGLESTKSDFAFSVFERTFKDFGLPTAIRTDNGTPFAAPCALFGLSRLSVWWLRLGIQIQRIKPGHPEQNGRHERMHLTLKKEATKPASFNVLQQQDRFDDFIRVYNNERPHQALGGAYPGDIYTPSTRAYEPPPDPDYPYHDWADAKSTSASCSPANSLAFAKSMTASGWSASWIMI